MNQTFGMRLQARRRRTIIPETGRHMTQSELASILRVSISTVQHYEHDMRLPLNAIKENILTLWPDFFLT